MFILLRCARNSLRCKNILAMPLVFQNNLYSVSVWSRAVSDAEKVVGYPTSFLGLRSLLSDEVSNIAVYLKKLIGTGHPLLTTAKKLIYGKDEMAQIRGLIVLLVAKATLPSAGHKDIMPSQRGLAEITELIHTAHLIHDGVIELSAKNPSLEYGNKMAILCGDFLLAQACTRLASLQNTKVVELVSKAISDMTTSEFCSLLPSSSSVSEITESWIRKCTLRYGSLLANSCSSAVLLSSESSKYQNVAHLFGLHFALAWQASTEINWMRSTSADQRSSSKTAGNLPLLVSLYKKGTSDAQRLEKDLTEPEIPQEAVELCNGYVNNTIAILSGLPESPARDALEKITRALYC